MKRLEGAPVFNQLGDPKYLPKEARIIGRKFSVFIQPMPRIDYEHDDNGSTVIPLSLTATL